MEREVGKEQGVKLWPEPGERLIPPEFEGLGERLKALLEGERRTTRMECFFDRGTGLLNKIFLYEFVKYLKERGEEGLLVIVFDFDNLKAYNTYFSDPEGGDRAIAEFVSAFRGAAEEIFNEIGGCWLVRIDGDTFATLFSEKSRRMGERLGKEVEERLSVSEWRPEKETEKFQVLPPEDQEVLRKTLFPPKVTASTAFLSVSSVEEFNKGLKRLNEEIRKKKDAKISQEVRALIARLG